MRIGKRDNVRVTKGGSSWEWVYVVFCFLMKRRPPRSTQSRSSAASDVYKRQIQCFGSGQVDVVHKGTDNDQNSNAKQKKNNGSTAIGFNLKNLMRIQVNVTYFLGSQFFIFQLFGIQQPVSYTHLRAHETVLDLV